MHFVGVDLAWSSKRTSAVAIATGNQEGASLRDWRADLKGVRAVVDFVESVTGGSSAFVAIDAPLVVRNPAGMRVCDRLAASVFRDYKAGVHPVNRSNLARYDGFQGERLASELMRRGYVHALSSGRRRGAKAFFETYPHAASIVLFGLAERLKYKARGRARPWSIRREAFRRYQLYLEDLRRARPAMTVRGEVLKRQLDGVTEARKKEYEDLLDSILCAYVAHYYWFWDTSKCAVLGDLEGGYMVLPMDSVLRERLSAVSSRLSEKSPA